MDTLVEVELKSCKKQKIKKRITTISSILIIGFIAVSTILFLTKHNIAEKSSTTLRNTAEEEDQNTEPLVILPKSGKYTHVIFFAHGLSSTPEMMTSFVRSWNYKLKSQTKLVLFRAPKRYVSLTGKTTTAWFDFKIDYNNLVLKADEKSINKTNEQFIKYIEEEAKALDGNYDRIILGGHSLGAMMSFHTGLSMEKKLGGLFILSGYLLPDTPIYNKERKNIRMFIAHGEKDTTILPSLQRMSLNRISNFKKATIKYYDDLAHTYTTEEIDDLVSFIDEIQANSN